MRQGGRAGIVFPNGILFGDTGSHLEVKKRLLGEFDLQAVVTLSPASAWSNPKRPNTPNRKRTLAGVAEKERRILEIVKEMRGLLRACPMWSLV